MCSCAMGYTDAYATARCPGLQVPQELLLAMGCKYSYESFYSLWFADTTARVATLADTTTGVSTLLVCWYYCESCYSGRHYHRSFYSLGLQIQLRQLLFLQVLPHEFLLVVGCRVAGIITRVSARYGLQVLLQEFLLAMGCRYCYKSFCSLWVAGTATRVSARYGLQVLLQEFLLAMGCRYCYKSFCSLWVAGITTRVSTRWAWVAAASRAAPSRPPRRHPTCLLRRLRQRQLSLVRRVEQRSPPGL